MDEQAPGPDAEHEKTCFVGERLRVIERRVDAGWSIDKHIPVAVIFTILLAFLGQAIVAVQWASRVELRVEALERQMVEEHDRDKAMERATAEADAALERRSIEAVSLLRAQLDRLDAKLDRLLTHSARTAQ